MTYKCIICGNDISDSIIKRNLRQHRPIRYCCKKCSANDPELQQRRKQTNLIKYGSEFVLQNKQILKKKVDTTIERYGDDYGKVIRQKGSITNLRKYGSTTKFNDGSSSAKYRSKHYDSFKQMIYDNQCIELLDDYQTYITTSIFHYRCINCNKQWESSNHDGYHMKCCSCCKNNLEAQILHYIKTILPNVEIKQNVKGLLTNKRCEIDIYIPSLNIGFEIDGNYWHSEHKRDKQCQQNKSLQCLKCNIGLFHVYESQWNSNRDNVQTQIKQFISNNQSNDQITFTLNLDCFKIDDINQYDIVSIGDPKPVVETDNPVYNSGTVTLRRK